MQKQWTPNNLLITNSHWPPKLWSDLELYKALITILLKRLLWKIGRNGISLPYHKMTLSGFTVFPSYHIVLLSVISVQYRSASWSLVWHWHFIYLDLQKMLLLRHHKEFRNANISEVSDLQWNIFSKQTFSNTFLSKKRDYKRENTGKSKRSQRKTLHLFIPLLYL